MNNLAEFYGQTVIENLEKIMVEKAEVGQVTEAGASARIAANDAQEGVFEWFEDWNAFTNYTSYESLDAWWSYSES